MFDDLRERAAAEYEDLEPEPEGRLTGLAALFGGLTAQQRFALALMLFFNVTVLGCMCLVAFGRIQF
jgi:hypothetical protein